MIGRRNLLLGVAALLGTAICTLHPALAAGESPKAFLEAIYALYQGVDPEGVTLSTDDDLRRYFTPDLAQHLIDDNKRAQASGDIPALDGDPFIDAQDWQITDLTIAVDDAATAKTTAKVSFKNTGQAVTVKLDLVKIGPDWKIDNIHWAEGDLRKLLAK